MKVLARYPSKNGSLETLTCAVLKYCTGGRSPEIHLEIWRDTFSPSVIHKAGVVPPSQITVGAASEVGMMVGAAIAGIMVVGAAIAGIIAGAGIGAAKAGMACTVGAAIV